MTIEELGAIGEVIGAVAVVASLVYLAIQIRQNTRQLSENMKATELAAFERNVHAGNRIRELLILNREIAELYKQGFRDYQQLTDADRLRFDMLLSNMFAEFQAAYIRHLTYRHDPEDYQGSKRWLDRLVRQQAVRDWLERSEPDWRPEFAALVAERVRQVARSSGRE